MSQHAYELLDRSNFEASQRQRYEQVVEVATAELGIAVENVLAVAEDRGLWAACVDGVFRADLRGLIQKRVEVGEAIKYREISEVRVEASGPHTHKVVLNGENRRKLAQINFTAGGPARTVDGAYVHCQAFAEVIESARSRAT
jgi:hypothetical protein